MNDRIKLVRSLCSATSSVLTAQELVSKPENREKLVQAELIIRMIKLSECPESNRKPAGHHGG